jgi:hypothetical protein
MEPSSGAGLLTKDKRREGLLTAVATRMAKGGVCGSR